MACLYKKDSEIYEKYILNRLSDQEKSDFKTHLASCKICQDRLEKEKWLQANLREIGKREMKSEIRKQVELIRTQKNLSDWGMMMRVAAIILFVVITPGIIYYYQYLAPPTDEHTVVAVSDKEKEEILTPQAGAAMDEGMTRMKGKTEIATGSPSKKIEQELKLAVPPPSKEGEYDQGEDMPEEIDNVLGKENLEKFRRVDDLPSFKVLSREAQVAGELEKNVGRSEPLPTMADDEAVFRYDSDKSTIDEYNETSGYYQSESLSELTVNQKSWLFRKSSREITIRLQLLDVKRDKDRKLPQKMPAQIITQDSLRLFIDCQVTPEFYEIDPDSVTLFQPNPQTLQIQLPRQQIYEIDLTQKSQDAIQIRR